MRVAAVQLGAAHHAVLAQQPHQAGHPAPGPRHDASLTGRYHRKNENLSCITRVIHTCTYIYVYIYMHVDIYSGYIDVDIHIYI